MDDGGPAQDDLPVGPGGLTWRRIAAGDLDAVHGLARSVAEADEPGNVPSRAEVAEQLAAVDLGRLSAVGIRDGRAVAFGLVLAVGFADAVRLPGGVDPAARGTGIGRALLAWQVRTARAVRPAPTTPVSARQPSGADRTAALLARQGFRPVRTFLHLRRPSAPLPVATLPAELRSIPFDARFDEPLRLVKNAAFADHWRSVPETPEGWARHQLGPALRRDLSRLAVATDGRIAGFVLAHVADEQPGEVYVALVGTDPAWRGRGVARALITEVVGAAAERGRPVAALDVDASSPTAADRLYASIGFERASEAIIHGLER